MAITFHAVILAALLATPSAVAVEGNEHMLAEVGVHHIMRRESNASETTDSAATLTTSTAYSTAVLASNPVAYWHLGEAAGDKADAEGPACGQDGGVASGDMCTVAGNIKGSPSLGAGSLIPTNTEDKAISFDGSSDQEITIPDHNMINTAAEGYEARTVELWFKAGASGDINRTIYEEGNEQHSGLNIYVREVANEVELFMYAWDRGNAEIDFGDNLVNHDPVRCAIQKDTPYYAAFVFSMANNSVSGYIRRPSSNKVELCGQMLGLPNRAKIRHHGHDGGSAVIGGVDLDTRSTGSSVMSGTTHNFVGTIDEVAVYNRALPQDELQAHVTAALLDHSGN